MPKIIDITGKKFGRLLAVERVENIPAKNAPSRPAWRCVCDCGNEKVLPKSSLVYGVSTSCGCYRKEVARKKNTSHGMSDTPEYNIWIHMKKRCFDRSCRDYKDYGARGISVCEQWISSFENFIESVGKRPTKYHTIERIDNNHGYSPDNCKWATRKEQSCNRRSIRMLYAFGKNASVSEWAALSGVRAKTILARIDRLGWTAERAVSSL